MMLINGQPGELLPASDRGLQYGDGLFETIAVKNGQPVHWEAHMQRLAEGCARLAIPMPAMLADEAGRLCKQHEQAVLKIIVTRGSGGRGYRAPVDPVPTRILAIYDWPNYPDSYIEEGVKLRLCHTMLSSQPNLAGIKHLNRLEQVLARNEWQDNEFAEGLMSNASGHVVEGTMSNYFAVKGGELFTPLLSDCGIAGIMRSHIIDVATQSGIGLVETTIRVDDLYTMDELFVCNSIIGIWPVKRLEGRGYPAPGPVTRKLLTLV